ncbi:MAG: 7-carboxy-7-deazaguanine synthase QueE [Bacteroidota bacterium]
MNKSQKDRDFSDGLKLPLSEEFYSIQGEGFHTGKAAYFIRIGGCDIACSWCDTKFSWESECYQTVRIDEIIRNILKNNADSIMVTGGEPSMFNLEPLTVLSHKYNIKTYLETSGNHKITGEWDWVCLSPKQCQPPVIENYLVANELKVIIKSKSDLNWAENCSKQISINCKLFLQPEWSCIKMITPKIVEYIKKNPRWNLSLQVHKYIGIP